MHIALVEGIRTQPTAGLSGHCPVCERDMIAKCGDIRVHHWAHRGRRVCDHWWEPETLWHRNWKNRFDIGWHESIRHAADGEKHVADIRTPHELVIEFQHSPISAEERASRENFYGNMVWVVDGTRLQRDFTRFEEERAFFGRTSNDSIFLLSRPESVLPRQWLASSVPVFFDFLGAGAGAEPARRWLWCLLPGRAEGQGVLAAMSRDTFVAGAQAGPTIIDSTHFVESLARSLRANEAYLSRRPSFGTGRYLVSPRLAYRRPRRRF